MDKLKIMVVDDESRMRKLVKDFLKKKDFELRPTNLQTVIEGAVHTALPSMADKNISLKGRYDDGFCLMESDLV